MTKPFRHDDENLIEKVFAIPPEERQAVLLQITRDWPPDRLWQTVHEWLVLSVRLDGSPGDRELAALLGAATERLQWVAHRVPASKTPSSPDGTTPESLAVGSLGRIVGQQKGGRARKKRKWAEVLAERLHRDGHDKASAIRALEEDGGVVEDAPELEYRFYIQGKSVYCDDVNKTDVTVGDMTVRNFFECYFRRN